MSRCRAFIAHLLVSVGIALLAAVLVFCVWYPFPLHKAIGVTSIFLLLLAVDVVVGPCLTFLVFSPGKKTLMFDLAVIVLLQLAALTYGIWSVFEGRPVWLVFNADRFDVVRGVDVDVRSLPNAVPEYKNASWLGPGWVAAVRPERAEERTEILFEALTSGIDLAQRPEYYRLLKTAASEISSRARRLDELLQYNDHMVVERVLEQWPQADGWLAMMSNAEDMVVLVQRGEGSVVAIVDLRPWHSDRPLE